VNEKTNRDEGHCQPEQSCRRLKKPIHNSCHNGPPRLSQIEGSIKDGLSLRGLIVHRAGDRPDHPGVPKGEASEA
jgi:hypothetical protein